MARKSRTSKDEYLDKKLLKTICRTIYCCGLGDCWYEPMRRSMIEKVLYIIWCITSTCYLASVVLSELSAFTTELTVRERNDNLQLSIAHPTILLKFLTVYLQRNNIKNVLKKLLEDTRVSWTKETQEAVVKRAKTSIIMLTISMASCMFFALVDGIRLHFAEGIPIRTLVTSWPHRTDTGFIVNVVRFFVHFHWWYLIGIMVVCDSMCVTALIMLCYKFRILQEYFKGLRRGLLSNVEGKSRDELDEEYRKSFVFGVKLHSETLWCAREAQNALGTIYSIQIVQSIALLAMCLIKLVRLERNLTTLIANASFIECMLALTGTYMMTCGDITYEASLVSSAMYESGWELCGSRADLPVLVVIAIQRSQVPVIMTAFGIYDLSYTNFISVLRSSYSFFAVMY